MTSAAGLSVSGIADSHAADRPRHAYNLGVQGLRGIAILLVLLNHAAVPGFDGGFIGVDVFFVISGYLIGGLLLREMETTGRIDLWAFYARRVRRLLPASLVLLVVVLIGIRCLYAPREQDELLSSARASALYAANLWFASRPTDYFGGHTEANPLLHLWSLAVEEQFYLVWPLLMLAAAKAMAGQARKGLRTLIWVAGVPSLVACVVLSLVNFKYAFFLGPMRVWEFAAGMFVAVRPGMASALSPRALRALGLTCLGVLLLATLFYDGSLRFPGHWAVWPVAATAGLLMVAERGGASLPGRCLHWGWLRWVGDSSYSLYLWHWPVLIAAAMWSTHPGPGLTVALIVVSLALGRLSYRFVEQAFQLRAGAESSPRRVVLVGLAACVGLAVAAQVMRGHIQAPSPQDRFQRASQWTLIESSGCLVLFDAVDQPPCEFGPAGATKTVVLLGDSHAAQWLPPLNALAQKHGWRLVVLTKAVCPSADVDVQFYVTRSRFEQCAVWRERMFERIATLRPQLVVMASSSGYADVELPRWQAGLQRSVERLKALGSQVAYIRDTPHTGLDVPTCWARADWWGWVPPNACTFERSREDQRMATRVQVEQAAMAARGARFIDLSQSICGSERCPTQRDGMLMFKDRTHLSEPFAAALAPQLEPHLLPLLDIH